MPVSGLITPVVDDVLVNRRRGRFSVAFDGTSILLQRDQASDRTPPHAASEALQIDEIDDVDVVVTDRRVRLRFRSGGAQWTLRWFDTPRARTDLLLDALGVTTS